MAAKKKLFTKVLSQRKKRSYAVFPKDDGIGRKRSESLSFDESTSYSIAGQAPMMLRSLTETLE